MSIITKDDQHFDNRFANREEIGRQTFNKIKSLQTRDGLYRILVVCNLVKVTPFIKS